MLRFRARVLAGAAVAGILAGCGLRFFEQRDPWRSEAEARCLAEGQVQASAFVAPQREINGQGACGMDNPFKVAAFAEGYVGVKPEATLACPIIPMLTGWMGEAVQPAAMRWFGQPVVEIKQISAYSCRSQNGQPGARISEHAFGNALDIASFRLADERLVTVKDGWRGAPEERGFLREIHAAACERFNTVLGPGADMFHYDHFHVDLARRQNGRAVCKPIPGPPEASPADLVARNGPRRPVPGGDPFVTGSIRKGGTGSRMPIDEAMPGGRLPRAIPGAD